MKAFVVAMEDKTRRREVEIGALETLVVLDDHGNEIAVDGHHIWGMNLHNPNRRLFTVQEAANSLGVVAVPFDWNPNAERERGD